MSRNGSGVYSAVVGGGAYPAVSGTLIESAKFNVSVVDIATALTESIARDGQTTLTADIPFAGYKITGLGAGTASTHGATVGQVQSAAVQWAGTAGGTADALTLTPTPAITAYAAGQTFRFKSGAGANTGAATVNISAVGAIAIQLNGAALIAGDIEASKWYQITLSDATTAQLQKIGNPTKLASLTMTGNVTMSGGVINEAEGAAVASAATINLDTATGNFLHVTGTTGITAVTLAQGAERTIVFDGALTLTHGASLILPTAANITTAADDVAVFRGEGAGVTRCVAYQKADGGTLSGISTAASQAQMEAASSNAVAATPGTMNWHPGVAKAFLKCDAAGTINASHGVTSITDAGVGLLRVTWSTAFSSVNYSQVMSPESSGGLFLHVENQLTTLTDSSSRDTAGTLTDPTKWFVCAFGDQ
jgi:hypothetical protein